MKPGGIEQALRQPDVGALIDETDRLDMTGDRRGSVPAARSQLRVFVGKLGEQLHLSKHLFSMVRGR